MFFLRQYIKGIKNSGTKDIWSGDFVPTEEEVVEAFGENGKYVLFERGRGIRGMRKVAQVGLLLSLLLWRIVFWRINLPRRSGFPKCLPQKVRASM